MKFVYALCLMSFLVGCTPPVELLKVGDRGVVVAMRTPYVYPNAGTVFDRIWSNGEKTVCLGTEGTELVLEELNGSMIIARITDHAPKSNYLYEYTCDKDHRVSMSASEFLWYKEEFMRIERLNSNPK